MTPSTLPALALGLLFGVGLVAWPAARSLGRNAGYVLAAGFAAASAVLFAALPEVGGGGVLESSYPWVPELGARLSLRLDGLSLLFALVITVIGAAVMAYTARYLAPGDAAVRLYVLLSLFAAAMLGLVLAGDALLLFVFWELTTVISFLLIAGKGSVGRRPATIAFLVTALGGLALFAAMLLSSVVTDSFDIATFLARSDAIRGHAFAGFILPLLMFAAFTKSAQVPFHFWLPGAMVAPTPVSTYLHAATMVKGGIYLLARFSPLFESSGWRAVIVFTGLATAIFGAVVALKKHDLKALLAYSTISQLGFLTALVGIGNFAALAAAGAGILAHAAYKATLFMIAGVVDRETGTRDIRELSGLRRAMPVTATVAGLAVLSMVGLPPFIGFVGKEEAFGAFLAMPEGTGVGWLATLGAVVAMIFTFAYGARLFLGTFSGPVLEPLGEPRFSFLAPAALTAAVGIVGGIVVSVFDPIVGRFAGDSLLGSGEVHLTLWHGLSMPLALSAIVVVAGASLSLARAPLERALAGVTLPFEGRTAFDGVEGGVFALGRRFGAPFVTPSLARHLAWLFAATATAGAAAWGTRALVETAGPPRPEPADWVVILLLAATCGGVTRATKRITAAALVGMSGFLVATLYVLFGAPDLVLTQLLVETLTVVVIVLVFRHLPQKFVVVTRIRKRAAVGVAVGTGVLAAVATFVLTGRRPMSDAGAFYLEQGPKEAGGKNIVNTILVDFRALDTLGEITVLAVAALGIYSLVRVARAGAR